MYSSILDNSIEPESIGPSVLVEKIERGEQTNTTIKQRRPLGEGDETDTGSNLDSMLWKENAIQLNYSGMWAIKV